MLETKEVTDLLRARGFKVTPQRLAVYSALAKTDDHPNAETIYKELSAYYPTMSLATVYKSLAILCEIGIAQELNVGEEAFRYDAKVFPHSHVRCTRCGCVSDVPQRDYRALLAQVEADTSYRVASHQMYFYGVCPACQQLEAIEKTSE